MEFFQSGAFMGFVLFAIVAQGAMAAEIAEGKGYSALVGFLMGALIPIAGIVFEAGRIPSFEAQKQIASLHARAMIAEMESRGMFDKPDKQ